MRIKNLSAAVISIFSSITIFFLSISAAHAATIAVTTSADELNVDEAAEQCATGNSCSLREAIFVANADSENSYTITVGEEINEVFSLTHENGTLEIAPGANITITGSFGISGENTYQIFRVLEGAQLTLNNVNLVQGYFDYDQYLMDSYFDGDAEDDNTFAGGGAIYNSGTVTLNTVLLENNTSDAFGGAIYNEGTLTIEQSDISKNAAAITGGGIVNAAGEISITNTTLSENAAPFGGAIVQFANDETQTESNVLDISRSSITQNTATNGAGIYSLEGVATITNTTIAQNEARASAGAVYSTASSEDIYSMIYDYIDAVELTVEEYGQYFPEDMSDELIATFLESWEGIVKDKLYTVVNQAEESSLDITSYVRLTNATIVDNTAGLHAGGISVRTDEGMEPQVKLQATILARNTDTNSYVPEGEGEPTENTLTPECRGSITSGGSNLILDDSGCTINDDFTDLIGVDPELAESEMILAADNNTIAYPLTIESPAINAVIPGDAYGVTVDQRGFERRGYGDIGAYEYNDFTAPVIQMNGDDEIVLKENDFYSDEGAVAYDDVDGILAVASDGDVSTSQPGVYFVRYTATDFSGNEALATRVVTVHSVGSNDSIDGSTTSEESTQLSSAAITTVKAAKKNRIKVIYEDGTQEFFKVFKGNSKKKNKIVILNDSTALVVHANGKSIAMVDYVEMKKTAQKKLSKKKYKKVSLKTMKFKGKKFAIVTAKKKNSARISIVKLKPKKGKLGKKDAAMTHGANIQVSKTAKKKNQLLIRNAAGETISVYRVKKRPRLAVAQ